MKENNNQLLFDATKALDVSSVKELIQAGEDVNARDEDDNTPFLVAVSSADYDVEGAGAEILDIMQQMVKEGLPASEITPNKAAVFWVKKQQKEILEPFKEILQILKDAGADINAKNKNGEGAYELAKGMAIQFIVLDLLSKGN